MAEKTVIVIDVQGEITYTTPDDKTPCKLEAGAVLTPDSTVKLTKGATVALFENHPIFINKTGKRNINKLIDKDLELKRGTFEYFFKDQLNYALGDLKDEPGPNEEYGFVKTTTNEEDDDTTDGWGENALAIHNVMPCGEQIVPIDLKFEWTPMTGIKSYELTVKDVDEDVVILTACVGGVSVKTDLKDLAIEADKEYSWQVVSRGGASTVKSQKAFFKITEADAKQKSMEKLDKVSMFPGSGTVLQGFMLAIRFERDKLLSEAYKIYEGLTTRYPDNVVVKRMFMAFLWRNGMRALARELMKTIEAQPAV